MRRNQPAFFTCSIIAACAVLAAAPVPAALAVPIEAPQEKKRGLQQAGTGPVVRWASTGGGWRSMASVMGYANLFAQAGLLPTDVTSSANSPITAISTNSGAAWFSTQLFYSPVFYNSTVASTPAELGDFVTQWMNAYALMQQDAPSNAFCESISNILSLATAVSGINATEICDIYMQYNDGSWADFISSMLNATSTAYGDPGFVTRAAGAFNRVGPLSRTDLFVPMSLAPNAKCGSTISYLSPINSPNQVYAVPLAAQHAVKVDGTLFQVGAPPTELPLTVSVHAAPETYNESDFGSFYLFPGTGGQVTTTPPSLSRRTRRGGLKDFQPPFGGSPTVTQVVAASSASPGAFSESAPSMMSQAYSKILYEIKNSKYPSGSNGLLLRLAVGFVEDDVYSSPSLENLSVGSQWPEPCSRTDSRFIDGGFTDGPSLAMNIGQYQTVDQGDLSRTLKILLTDTNNYGGSDLNVLSYFATSVNSGVAPGDFIWPGAPEANATNSTFSNILSQLAPLRSTQIFQEYMDKDAVEAATVAVPGTNLTYAILNATTLDNPTYGVVAGQPVQILLLSTNSDIPTLILGSEMTQQYTGPLAELSETIAGSATLLSAVQSFVATFS